jgi:predicted DCC family thiol-disulfide oxidoreductase YuxK
MENCAWKHPTPFHSEIFMGLNSSLQDAEKSKTISSVTTGEKSGRNNSELQTEHLILFDGICLLCEGFVRFLLRHDKKKIFKFATLQSSESQTILKSFGEEFQKLDSVLLVSSGKVFHKSQAVFQMALLLGYPWKIFALFRLVPDFISNGVYDFIARNRYRWFGKREECLLPNPEIKSRFLGEISDPN